MISFLAQWVYLTFCCLTVSPGLGSQEEVLVRLLSPLVFVPFYLDLGILILKRLNKLLSRLG
jgi:hypothetical protein